LQVKYKIRFTIQYKHTVHNTNPKLVTELRAVAYFASLVHIFQQRIQANRFCNATGS